LIRAWEDLPMREAIEAGVEVFVESWNTREAAERMRDFVARRKQPR
jgi:enoyl-CoA hydratase